MHLLYYLTVRTDVIEPVEASREELESTYPIQDLSDPAWVFRPDDRLGRRKPTLDPISATP